MAFPEDFEKFPVRNFCRVIFDPDSLGMVSDIIVGGVRGGPPGISHPGAHYAVQKPEPGIRSPESPQGKGRRFQAAGYIPVEGGNLRRERLS